MKNQLIHIPLLETITDFFIVYGIGKPLHSDIMCMRLEDQPDDRLLEMPLYRSNFFRIIHFENADLHFKSADNEHTITQNCLCFSYPTKLESWTRKGRLYGTVIYFTPNFAGFDRTHQYFDQDYPFFNFESEPVLPLSPQDIDDLRYCEQELLKEMGSNAPDKLDYLRKILHVYLHKIKRIYTCQTLSLSSETQTNKSIFNRFRHVLEVKIQELADLQHQPTTPSVSNIAQELHINANYLNDVIKKLTGKTASSFIQDKLILEAKSYLIHTPLHVAEIAYRLGFGTPQYFNRFFKKHCNITPLEFRHQFTTK
ncbi:MAG: helix-turn-helix transcriptional regulator [Bacteroidia bacterium]|nr:helix-turn-helix transcriptional regulator [Bacteroidia bacterium]